MGGLNNAHMLMRKMNKILLSFPGYIIYAWDRCKLSLSVSAKAGIHH